MEVYRPDPERCKQAGDDVGTLSEPAAAKFLGISPRSLFALRQAGRGPRHVRIGKRVLYPRHLLVAYLDDLAQAQAVAQAEGAGA